MCYRLWEAAELHCDIMVHWSAVIQHLCNNLTPQWSNAKSLTLLQAVSCTYIWTDWHTCPKEAWPVFYVTTLPLCQCSHPPPSSVSSASHDGLDVIFLFFPLKTGEQKLACVCVLKWAIAKCFYNDVMLLLCSPPAPLPLLLHHLDSLAPFREATHKCKHKRNQVSIIKKDKWMMTFTQSRCAWYRCA